MAFRVCPLPRSKERHHGTSLQKSQCWTITLKKEWVPTTAGSEVLKDSFNNRGEIETAYLVYCPAFYEVREDKGWASFTQ